MIPPVASRFVAGETPAEALEHARRTNAEGVGVILNLLGEHYRERAAADADLAAYLGLLDDVDGSGLEVRLSVKPSQLGLSVDEAVFRENYRRLAEAADRHGVVLWCDMEDSSTTDATIDAFETLATDHPGRLGLCLQSNLRRTHDDLERLVDAPGQIRLVKGAYDEPPDVAYTSRESVNDAYRADLEYLFRERESGVAVGSHDPAMIEHARTLAAEHGTDFEFQMLMGVRESAQRDLADRGYEVWQYAPYGRRWLSYFLRRVRERRENLLFALWAILGG